MTVLDKTHEEVSLHDSRIENRKDTIFNYYYNYHFLKYYMILNQNDFFRNSDVTFLSKTDEMVGLNDSLRLKEKD